MSVSSSYQEGARLIFGQQSVPLNKTPIRIGRASQGPLGRNDIVCGSAEEGVSRNHAEIRVVDGRALLSDLSKNGTFLQRQGKQYALSGGLMALCDGDIIQFAEGPKCRVDIRGETGSIGEKAANSVGQTTLMRLIGQVSRQTRSMGRRMMAVVMASVAVGIVVVAIFVIQLGLIEQEQTQIKQVQTKTQTAIEKAQTAIEKAQKIGYSRDDLEQIQKRLREIEGKSEKPAWIPPVTELELAAEILKKVGPSVVRISGGKGTGSGFFVDKEGYIVTNKHVVEGAEHVVVYLDGKQEGHEATLVGIHPKLDLALLQARVPMITGIKLGSAENVERGETVVALGYPLGFISLHTTKGIVSNKMSQQMEGGIGAQVLITDAALNPGNSGGPLVNRDFLVVGVNTMVMASVQIGGKERNLQNMDVAIDARYVRELLAQCGVALE